MSSYRSFQMRFVIDLPRQLLFLEDLGVHAHDEDLLVVRTVEDADPAPLGKRLVRPPEEVVIQLLGRRPLEREDLAPLGVDARHDVLDRPVLPRRVHGLEDEENAPLVLRVELVLHLREELDPPLQEGLSVLLRLHARGGPRLHLGQLEVLPVRDPERLQERPGAACGWFSERSSWAFGFLLAGGLRLKASIHGRAPWIGRPFFNQTGSGALSCYRAFARTSAGNPSSNR